MIYFFSVPFFLFCGLHVGLILRNLIETLPHTVLHAPAMNRNSQYPFFALIMSLLFDQSIWDQTHTEWLELSMVHDIKRWFWGECGITWNALLRGRRPGLREAGETEKGDVRRRVVITSKIPFLSFRHNEDHVNSTLRLQYEQVSRANSHKASHTHSHSETPQTTAHY